MLTEINIPDIGPDEMEVTEILINVGDLIKKEQSIITIEGDKSIIEIPSSFSGTVKEIKVNVGDKVKTGSLVLIIDINNKNSYDINKHKEKKEIKLIEQSNNNYTNNNNYILPSNFSLSNLCNNKNDFSNKNVHTTPSVRRLARKLGINLIQIKGSGPKGRIMSDDIYNYVKELVNIKDSMFKKNLYNLNTSSSNSTSSIKDSFNNKLNNIKEEKIELTRIQKISSNNIYNSWTSIPHVTQFDEVDITDLEDFRKHQNNVIQKKNIKFKITLLTFIIKAISKGLNKFPIFNSYFSSSHNNFFLKKYINIGIAVDTPSGLLVPVIRDVNKKGIIEISQELSEIISKSRLGKLTLSEMKEGCFTISNLGNIGGTLFTPIIKSPEVAILGLSKSSIKPIWNGEKFIPRLILPLSLSYDHRLINGVDGIRFLIFIKEIISDIRLLIL